MIKYDEECCDLECAYLKEINELEESTTDYFIWCDLFKSKLDSYYDDLHKRCTKCEIDQKKKEIIELEKELNDVPFVSAEEQEEIERILENPECHKMVETEIINI